MRPSLVGLVVGILAWMLVLPTLIAPQVAHAAVVVSRAEVSSGRLRIEGSAAPSRTITVDGVALGTSDGGGAFRIERSGYTPPADCTVDVNDGSATPTPVRLAGCTVAGPSTSGGTGSISIVPGGNGSGTITSQPAGINCVITNGNGAGSCSAFFPAGTIVRLDARPAPDTQFQGWRGLPGCSDPSKITVFADTNINCQPGFQLKF